MSVARPPEDAQRRSPQGVGSSSSKPTEDARHSGPQGASSSDDIQKLAQRKLNFFQTLKAVGWGLFGVRKGKGYREDIGALNPVHLILAGLIAAAVFVTILVLAARWMVGLATA